MANMSYCRFQNTRTDLRDCLNALEEAVDCIEMGMGKQERRDDRVESFEDLSSDEARAAVALIEIAREIVENYGDCPEVAEHLQNAVRSGR